MAALASIVHQFHMLDMIKINRLLFLGIQQLGKNDPPHDETENNSDHKKKNDRTTRLARGRHPFLTIRCNLFSVVYFTHANSVWLLNRKKIPVVGRPTYRREILLMMPCIKTIFSIPSAVGRQDQGSSPLLVS
jgi:hypothetical protein